MNEAQETVGEGDKSAEVAGQLLLLAAKASSAVFDSFMSWVLAGQGAALTLVVGNLAGLQQFVDPAAVRCAVMLFVLAALFALVAKYLAAMVQGSAQSAAEALALKEKHRKEGARVCDKAVRRIMANAAYRPSRCLMRLFERKMTGPAAVGTTLSRMAQVQIGFGVVSSLLVLTSVAVMVCGFKS